VLVLDVRSATGIPLALGRDAHGLPNTRVTANWAPTVNYEPGKQLQSTAMVYENPNPIWNEQLVLRGQGDPKGFLFLSVLNDEEEVIDRISVPINFLEPHMTVSLALKMCKGEAVIYLAFNLQTRRLPSDSLDQLIQFGIKWVDLDPMPADSNFNFSLMLGKAGLEIGSTIPHARADTSDESSLSRAFYVAMQPTNRSVFYMSQA
jgi:hypothetical protein